MMTVDRAAVAPETMTATTLDPLDPPVAAAEMLKTMMHLAVAEGLGIPKTMNLAPVVPVATMRMIEADVARAVAAMRKMSRVPVVVATTKTMLLAADAAETKMNLAPAEDVMRRMSRAPVEDVMTTTIAVLAAAVDAT